jgi:hypothetical protein
MRNLLLAAGLVSCGSAANAGVTAVGSSGFVIENTIEIAAPPKHVFQVLTQPSAWWSSAHTWSGDSRNLFIELRPGGCWCERWKGGFAQHLQLVYFSHDRELGMWGALGPLRRDGFAGGLVVTLEKDGSRTVLKQSYTVGGYSRVNMADYAAGVDEVWRTQLARLKAVAEGRRAKDESEQ